MTWKTRFTSLAVLSFAVLSNILLTTTTNAASEYDNQFSHTGTLNPTVVAGVCEGYEHDFALDWFTRTTGEFNTPFYAADNPEHQAQKDKLYQAVTSGNGYYAVGGTNGGQFFITYSTDQNARLEPIYLNGNYMWKFASTNNTNNVSSVTVQSRASIFGAGTIGNTNNCEHWAIGQQNAYNTNAVYNVWLGNQDMLLNTFPTIYPENYGGVVIPDEIDQNTPEKPDLSPKFVYTVTDKDISAKDEKHDMPTYTPDEGYFFQGYSIKWYLHKCTNGFNDTIRMCNDSTIVNTKTLPIGEQYKYSVTDYSDYILEAEYLATECFRYAGYPATPDNCYLLQLNNVFPDYEFHSTNVHLLIDGKTLSGNTATDDCNVAGYCQTPDDGLGMFRALDNIATYGLQEFFIAPINFYATLASKVDNCTPITVPFLESSFQMTCMKQNYYNWSPTIMLLYTTIMTATTGYLIAFNIFRTIKNINTPDHDGIEVAKL